MAAVFREQDSGLFDLEVDGRIREYDVDPEDLAGALRRARLDPGTKVYTEDQTGYRTKI